MSIWKSRDKSWQKSMYATMTCGIARFFDIYTLAYNINLLPEQREAVNHARRSSSSHMRHWPGVSANSKDWMAEPNLSWTFRTSCSYETADEMRKAITLDLSPRCTTLMRWCEKSDREVESDAEYFVFVLDLAELWCSNESWEPSERLLDREPLSDTSRVLPSCDTVTWQ